MLIGEIVKACNGTLLCGAENVEVKCVSTNSKEIGDKCLFVPVIGERVDAHKFIGSAFENGAVAVLTSKHDKPETADADKPWIAVKDTVKALQDIGAYYGRSLNVPSVGVTGSVGKTTTKEMIAQALSAKYKVFKTSGNHNSQIGVPTTLLEIEPEDEYAVIEMGMSIKGEMKRLAELVDLDMAVMTNIGVSHIEQLGSREGICEEKMNICNALKDGGILILNGDDDILSQYRGKTDHKTYFYGTTADCDYMAADIKTVSNGVDFTLVVNEEEYPVHLNVPGKHNVLNALSAIAVAHNAGIDIAKAIESLGRYEGVTMRQQITKTDKYIVIDDSYNASPDSMKAGIMVLKDYESKGRKVAVLADMLELGEKTKEYHYEIGKFLAENKIDEVVVYGELAMEIARGAKENSLSVLVNRFNTRDEIAEYLARTLQKEDVVLLKGSRGMKLNEVVSTLL